MEKRSDPIFFSFFLFCCSSSLSDCRGDLPKKKKKKENKKLKVKKANESHEKFSTKRELLALNSIANTQTISINMSGRFPPQGAKEEPSTFEQIKKSPAFIVGTQAVLFGLGVLFIQSPLMDMLVPQL